MSQGLEWILTKVLILVLVEYTVTELLMNIYNFCEVLILVLVEYTVTVYQWRRLWQQQNCLNPCFSGIYRDLRVTVPYGCTTRVLILVLVEYTVTKLRAFYPNIDQVVLILVLVECIVTKRKYPVPRGRWVLILVLLECIVTSWQSRWRPKNSTV